MLSNPCMLGDSQTRGQNQTWLTLDFPGAQERAELLRNRCLLGGPQTRGQNQNGLPRRCRSWGSPTKGTKSEVDASPLPS